VYFGSYCIKNGHADQNGPEGVFEASEVPVQDQKRDWVGIGGGWRLSDQLERAMHIDIGKVYLDLCPSGLDLILMGIERYNQGLAIPAHEARPEYLREQVANLPQKKVGPGN